MQRQLKGLLQLWRLPYRLEKNNITAYIIKGAPLPAGSSLELIDGGAKIVLQSGDKLRAKSTATDSLDVIVSAVDSIST